MKVGSSWLRRRALTASLGALFVLACSSEPADESDGTGVTADAQVDVAGADAGLDASGDADAKLETRCGTAADCPDDGDPCTAPPACANGACQAALPVDCPTANDTWCLANSCDPSTGVCALAPRHEGAPCEDGDPCHLATVCAQGACAGGVDVCACHDDGDCPPSADLCAGASYCDKATWPWQCADNPASQVVCATGKDTACSKATCEPSTGKCAPTALPDGAACDDGDPCTQGDTCGSGSCQGGATNTCVCQSDADCDAKEDGDLCNGTLFCNLTSGSCELNPATVVECAGGQDSACLKQVCFPKSGLCQLTPTEKLVQSCAGGFCGWVLAPPGAVTGTKIACDDGDACTQGELCAKGTCTGGTDTCGCKDDADCAKLEDGNACNGTLFCNQVTGQCAANPATRVVCPAGQDTDCSKGACHPKTAGQIAAGGCALVPVGLAKKVCDGPEGPSKCRWEAKPAGAAETADLPCDDDDVCTAGDTCKGGVCLPGAATCTCQSDADCPDDGDLCNGTPVCHKVDHTCQLDPTSVVTCKTVDDTACLKNLCQAKTGQCTLTAVHEGQLCDDGDPCSQSDVCVKGACAPGPNVCECVKDADCVVKEDGNACNGTLYCDKSGAKPACTVNPATVVVCGKQAPSPCLADTCDPSKGTCGFAPANDAGSCDDGNACTHQDLCAAGTCQGKALDCDDGNACTVDTCTPTKGCVYVFKLCADGNYCTADLCDAKTGLCSFSAAAMQGAPCNADSSGCTLNDQCKAGVCTVGAPAACKVGPLGACEQPVCVSTDATSYTCKVGLRPNGAPCDDGKPCTVGSSCQGGTCSGKGAEKLFWQSYTGPGGHGLLHAVAQHDDGDLVAVGRGWKTGGTKVWWVLRTTAAGAVRWSRTLSTGSKGFQEANAVHTDAVGHTWVAGSLSDNKAGTDLALARWDHKGALVSKHQVSDASHYDTARALVVTPGSTALLAGGRSEPGTIHPLAALLDPGGKLLWQTTRTSPLGTAPVVGAVQTKDGAFLLVGQGSKWQGFGKPMQYYSFVWRLDAAGKELAFARVGGTAGPMLTGIATRGARVLLSWVDKPGDYSNSRAWLAELRPDLGLLWSGLAGSAARVNALTFTTTGQLALAGTRRAKGSTFSLWAAGADTMGNPTWSQAPATSDPGDLKGAAALADGGAVFAGLRTAGGKSRGVLLRVDPWGHRSCGAAGGCVDKSAGACDDAKPCTRDWCDAAAGCKHTTLEGLRCDPNDGCTLMSACAKGACKAGVAGRLWVRGGPVGSGKSQHADSAALGDGDTVIAGQGIWNGQHRAFVRALNPWGEQRWLSAWTVGGKATHAVAVTPLGNHDVVVASAMSDGKTFGDLRRLSSGGKVVWAKNVGHFTKYRPLALTTYADGTFGVLHQPVSGGVDRVFVTRYNPDLSLAWKSGNSSPFVFGSYGGKPWQPWRAADGVTTGAHLYGPRMAAHADGSTTVAAGLQAGSSKIEAWIGKLAPWGGVLWHKRMGAGQSYHVFFMGVASHPDGGAYATGARNTTTQLGWMVRFSAAGKVLWERTLKGYGYALNAAAPLADGGLLVAGSKVVNGKQRPFLGVESASGALGWQRVWSDRLGYVGSVRTLGGGDLLVGLSDGPSQHATLMHTDPWGHEGCAKAGACLSKSCDDNDPCTVDACAASGGCSHTKVPCG